MHWRISSQFVSYPQALIHMDTCVKALQQGREGEEIWLLEHPPLYTSGRRVPLQDLLKGESRSLPVYEAPRGGQYTYHGPGQRVAYLMLDLNKRTRDVRAFIHALEEWIIKTLAVFKIKGERRCDRVGVWVIHQGQEKKIAAIGIRLSQWITSHGLSLNVCPDLNYYQGIISCGLADYGITSFKELSVSTTLEEVDTVLKQQFFHIPFFKILAPKHEKLTL